MSTNESDETLYFDPDSLINNVCPIFSQARGTLESAASAISSINIPDDFECAGELSRMPSKISSSAGNVESIHIWIVDDIVLPLIYTDDKNSDLVKGVEDNVRNMLLNGVDFKTIKQIYNRKDIFNKDITYTIEYKNDGEDGGVMAYSLMTPSTVSDGKPKPVIVWLHGGIGTGKGEYNYVYEDNNYSLTSIIPQSELSKFDGYILSPQLKGKHLSNGEWANDTSMKNLAELMDKFISEHNVDRDNIVICGASLGGAGTIYTAANMPEYFSKAVVVSGYGCGSTKPSDSKIPIMGYVGKQDIDTVKGYMERNFGKENLKFVNTTHGKSPKEVFNLDEDGNGNPDALEWMFSDLTADNENTDAVEGNNTEKNNNIEIGGGNKKTSNPTPSNPRHTNTPIKECTPNAVIGAAKDIKDSQEITTLSKYISSELRDGGYISSEKVNQYSKYSIDTIQESLEMSGWKRITNKDKLKVGDILFINSDGRKTVQIYAGNNQWHTLRRDKPLEDTFDLTGEWNIYRPSKE